MLVKGKNVSGRIPRIRQKIKAPSPHNQLQKRPALVQTAIGHRPASSTHKKSKRARPSPPGHGDFSTCEDVSWDSLPYQKVHGRVCRPILPTYLPTVIPMSLSILYFMLAAPPRSHFDKSILRSYSLPADPLPSTSMFQGIYTMNFPAGIFVLNEGVLC